MIKALRRQTQKIDLVAVLGGVSVAAGWLADVVSMADAEWRVAVNWQPAVLISGGLNMAETVVLIALGVRFYGVKVKHWLKA